MKKIGLFFADFNPIHIGHMIPIEEVLEEKLVDAIWLAPRSPLLHEDFLPQRLDALKRMETPQIRFFNYRLMGHRVDLGINKTIEDLLKDKEYNDNEFSIIIGTDDLEVYQNSPGLSLLFDKLRFIVVPRYGFLPNLNNSLFKNRSFDHVLLNTTRRSPICSQVIREKIKENFKVTHLLPEKIHPIFKEKNAAPTTS